MKKVMLLLLFLGTLTACSEDDSTDTGGDEIIEHNITINNTASYTYVLGAFGDEEGAAIQVEPEHALTNELDRNFDTGVINYFYEPLPNYTGTDYIELMAARGSDGASANDDITIVKITLNITE